MEVPILVIADYANRRTDSKLDIMGIHTLITAPAFPALCPQMYLVVKLVAGPSEYGRTFKLGIKFINEDATQFLVDETYEVTLGRESDGLQVEHVHIHRLINFVFEKPGIYQFSVLVDSDTKAALAVPCLHRPS